MQLARIVLVTLLLAGIVRAEGLRNIVGIYTNGQSLATGRVAVGTNDSTFYVGNATSNAVKVGDAAWSNSVTASITNSLVATNDARALSLTGGIVLGTNTVNRAPLQFTYPAGPLLTNITPGAVEYGAPGFEHTFFMTTYLVRRSVVLAQNVLTNDTTYTGFSTATNVYQVVMAPNFIKPGKVIEIALDGIYSLNTPQNFVLSLLHNTNILIATTSTVSTASSKPWELMARLTFRSTGTNGQVMAKLRLTQDNTANMDALAAAATIDTTITNTITVQMTPSANGNSWTLQQGRTLCIDMVPGQ